MRALISLGAALLTAPSAILAAPPVGPPELGVPVSLSTLAERLQPAVVTIAIRQTLASRSQDSDDDPPRQRRSNAEGSGFIISADGYVVTNNHVVAPANGNARIDSIILTLSDGREIKAQIVGRDSESDLALLKAEATGLPFVRFGDSTRTKVGDWVMVIGNPFGLGTTVSAGIVSALHRNLDEGPYDRYIQTDASINRGNSGGPMFDLNGNVVGINTMIISPTGASVGVGFAVPAEQAQPVIDALKAGARPPRGYMGLSAQPVDSDNLASALGVAKHSGDLVKTVMTDSPAHRAGIERGDVITRVNGMPVTHEDRLTWLISVQPIGRSVPVELVRDGQRRIVSVMIGNVPSEEEKAKLVDVALPPAPARPNRVVQRDTKESLGIGLEVMTPEFARSRNIAETEMRGVVVSSVDPSGNAEGVRARDVILSIDRVTVATPQDVAAAVEKARRDGHKSVLLLIKRGRQQQTTTFVGVPIIGS